MKLVFKKRALRGIVFALLMLPYLEPLSFKQEYYGWEFIDSIYSILKVIVFLGLFVYSITIKTKVSKALIFQGLYAAVFLLATILNGSGYVGFKMYAGPALSPLAIILLFDIFEDDIEFCIKSLNFVFVIYCTINFITFIQQISIYGLNDNCREYGVYFFSMDNRMIFYFIPAIICALIVSYFDGKKMNCWTWILLIHAELMFVALWTVGSMIGMTLIILWLVFLHKFISSNLVNMKKLFLLIIILNILAYAIAFIEPLNLLSRSIAMDLFDKGGNLNDRFVMWKNVVDHLKSTPLLGDGIKPITFNYLRFGVSHAHNLFMDTILKTGILGTILFFCMLKVSLKPLYVYRNNPLAKKICFIVFVAFVISLADTYNDALFYCMLNLSRYIGKIIEKDKYIVRS